MTAAFLDQGVEHALARLRRRFLEQCFRDGPQSTTYQPLPLQAGEPVVDWALAFHAHEMGDRFAAIQDQDRFSGTHLLEVRAEVLSQLR